MSKFRTTLDRFRERLSVLNLDVTVLPFLIFIACSLIGHLLQSEATPCGLVDQCSQINSEMHITH